MTKRKPDAAEPQGDGDDTPLPRMPRTVTLRWLSRQLIEAHARARSEGELRVELAALNALAKLHGLNRESDIAAAAPGESLTIYLPDNGRDTGNAED